MDAAVRGSPGSIFAQVAFLVLLAAAAPAGIVAARLRRRLPDRPGGRCRGGPGLGVHRGERGIAGPGREIERLHLGQSPLQVELIAISLAILLQPVALLARGPATLLIEGFDATGGDD